MAPLPSGRGGEPVRAFWNVAVDYAGPFLVKQGRGQRRLKRYLCVFTCQQSRAVHFEVAFDLSTDGFLNAFLRFVSRRGLPSEALSDNGTNFVGAVNELKQLVASLDDSSIQRTLADKGVKWIFNPPQAPHFGGVHESMVKAAKKAILAVLGNASVSDEEFLSAAVGAEGLLNSRLIVYVSTDVQDNVPLTPNHFLFGSTGGQFAPRSVDSTPFSVSRRWRYIQELVRQCWQRWLREWLPTLNSRRQWQKEQRNLSVGDVVVVVSPDAPRGDWPLGRVLEVFPGRDGLMRVAKVLVGKKTMVRPVTRLCYLPTE